MFLQPNDSQDAASQSVRPNLNAPSHKIDTNISADGCALFLIGRTRARPITACVDYHRYSRSTGQQAHLLMNQAGDGCRVDPHLMGGPSSQRRKGISSTLKQFHFPGKALYGTKSETLLVGGGGELWARSLGPNLKNCTVHKKCKKIPPNNLSRKRTQQICSEIVTTKDISIHKSNTITTSLSFLQQISTRELHYASLETSYDFK